MRFNAPLWLWCALGMALLLVMGWRMHDRRQRAALQRFVAPQLALQLTQSVSKGRLRLQRGSFLLAMLSLCVALAGPLFGFQWQLLNRRGDQIIFAIDTSRSMLTPDLKPNRLIRAKLAIDDLARQLDGNAMGVVAFAGTAFLACPLTFDVSAFRASLGAIDTRTIPRGGTNVASAIRAAQSALGRRPASSRIVILVTDGEDLDGGALAAAEAAAKEGIKVFAIGVGSAAGELIPLPVEDGGGFVKDESGAFVHSKLDEGALRAIAAAAGGIYVALGTQGNDVDAALNGALQALAKEDLASRQQRIYTQRYQWPLGAALLFLMLSQMTGNRRARRDRKLAAAGATVALMVLLATPFGPIRAADAEPKKEEPVHAYNEGTAAYRAGRFTQAGDAFARSIRQAPSDAVRRLADQQDAYYDLGNSLYRSGQATQQSSKEDTLKAWNAAVKAYDTALQMRPQDTDARYNRDFVKKKIDDLNQDKPPQGGGGQGKPPPGQPPPGQPPPGQPPPGQPPPGQPPPGQQPPGQAPPGQSPPGQAPPASPDAPGNKPPPGQPTPQPPGNADPGGLPPGEGADGVPAERVPGQMSSDEARQLLDSAKSDEKHTLTAPAADEDDYHPPPDKPFKNW